MTDDRPPTSSYESRLARVTAYIHDNLDAELDLDSLADIACLSRWHWHRVYLGALGESVTATVRRLRLQRAAAELAHTGLTIAEVANRAHYPSTSVFTRVFRTAYGITPAVYRRSGLHRQIAAAIQKGDKKMFEVRIDTRPAMQLAGVPHNGAYTGIGKAFETLYGTLFSRALFRPGMDMIGIYFDDPDLVAVDKLTSAACVTVADDFPFAPPLTAYQLPAGDFAVLTHKGPYSDLPTAYQWLFGVWMGQSGRELRDSPVFERYLNTPQDTAPSELLTEIWAPIQPASVR